MVDKDKGRLPCWAEWETFAEEAGMAYYMRAESGFGSVVLDYHRGSAFRRAFKLSPINAWYLARHLAGKYLGKAVDIDPTPAFLINPENGAQMGSYLLWAEQVHDGKAGRMICITYKDTQEEETILRFRFRPEDAMHLIEQILAVLVELRQ